MARSVRPPAPDALPPEAPSAEIASELSRQMVAFYKNLYGRGPSAARTLAAPGVAVTILREVLTPGERMLVNGGHLAEVEEVRLRTAEVTYREKLAVASEVLGLEVTTAVYGIAVADDVVTETFLFDTP